MERMNRGCLLSALVAMTALVACHKENAEQTKDAAQDADAGAAPVAHQAVTAETAKAKSPNPKAQPLKPIACGDEIVPAEEAANWVCLDDVLVCFSKDGCVYNGTKIPDRVMRFKGIFYCAGRPLPSKFDGLTCFDEMSANIGARFDENSGLVCTQGTCLCGDEVLTPPQGCITKDMNQLPEFSAVHPDPVRLRNTTLFKGTMYCGNDPFPANDYMNNSSSSLYCVNDEWLCGANCRCSGKESTGRFGHCKDGRAYCAHKQSSRPKNEEIYACRHGAWVCPDPGGCACAKNTCAQGQYCDGKTCSGDAISWPSELVGGLDLAKCGDPAAEMLSLIGPERVLAKKDDPRLRCSIRTFCDSFYVPKEQYENYACELGYDYIVSYDASSLEVRENVRGLRCIAKEGCACENDTCPYGALCSNGRCILDRNYSVMACNNKPMMFSRDTIRRECLFQFGSERYTDFFKTKIDPARLPFEGELSKCDLDLKKWNDDYLARFEYWDGDSWLIDTVPNAYYITPDGECKCGYAVLPPSMVGSYECDASIGYVCKNTSGCACGASTCSFDQACLRPGVCADAT